MKIDLEHYRHSFNANVHSALDMASSGQSLVRALESIKSICEDAEDARDALMSIGEMLDVDFRVKK